MAAPTGWTGRPTARRPPRLLAYGRGDPTELVAAVGDAEDATDPIVRAWWWMREAVVDWLAGDKVVRLGQGDAGCRRNDDHRPRQRGSAVRVQPGGGHGARGGGSGRAPAAHGVRRGHYRRPAVPLHFSVTSCGRRPNCPKDPEPGLREALEVFTAMGAGYPAARVAVELVAAWPRRATMPRRPSCWRLPGRCSSGSAPRPCSPKPTASPSTPVRCLAARRAISPGNSDTKSPPGLRSTVVGVLVTTTGGRRECVRVAEVWHNGGPNIVHGEPSTLPRSSPLGSRLANPHAR